MKSVGVWKMVLGGDISGSETSKEVVAVRIQARGSNLELKQDHAGERKGWIQG